MHKWEKRRNLIRICWTEWADAMYGTKNVTTEHEKQNNRIGHDVLIGERWETGAVGKGQH